MIITCVGVFPRVNGGGSSGWSVPLERSNGRRMPRLGVRASGLSRPEGQGGATSLAQIVGTQSEPKGRGAADRFSLWNNRWLAFKTGSEKWVGVESLSGSPIALTHPRFATSDEPVQLRFQCPALGGSSACRCARGHPQSARTPKIERSDATKPTGRGGQGGRKF
jgi:hypothetical protein